MADADVKPDIKPDISNEKITITVGFEGQTFRFSMKPTTALKKVFDSVEQQVSAQPGTLKFTFEGNRVQAQETLSSLGVEGDDDVEFQAHLEQIGGSGF